MLIAKLSRRFAPYVRDELILAIAAILGAGSFLYPHYRSFLDDAAAGLDSLRDELTQNRLSRTPREQVVKMLDLMGEDHARFAKAARALLATLSGAALDAPAAEQLADGLADREILSLDRYRFLVAAVVTWAVVQDPPTAARRASG